MGILPASPSLHLSAVKDHCTIPAVVREAKASAIPERVAVTLTGHHAGSMLQRYSDKAAARATQSFLSS